MHAPLRGERHAGRRGPGPLPRRPLPPPGEVRPGPGALSLRRAVTSLRGRIVLYLVLLHLVFGAIAWLSLRKEPLYLLGIELLFAASIAVGVLLVRAFFLPLELIQTGALLIRERD